LVDTGPYRYCAGDQVDLRLRLLAWPLAFVGALFGGLGVVIAGLPDGVAYSETVFPPARLARYRASSAARVRAARVSPSSG
jgi:hypothetical protein